jgi:CheY-like chemotaxis protein
MVDLLPPDRKGHAMARIQVIDDDQAVRTTLRLLLEREGHEVFLAEDGRKGIEQFESEAFDLLIVDIFMPGMDGLETIRTIHRLRPETPIIVISGYAFRTALETVPDFLEMAVKFGAVSSLKKPFRPSELMSVVTACLESPAGGPRTAANNNN